MKGFSWFRRKRSSQLTEEAVPERAVLGYRAAFLQGQGSRERQEDSYALINHQDVKSLQKTGLLAIVADGMGGMKNGKLASEMAVQSLSQAFCEDAPLEEPAQWLKQQSQQVGDRICQTLEGQGGTTMVACVVCQEKLWFVSVGDSFLYLLRDGELSRLNRLQTVLQREFMQELESGSADPAQAREHEEAHALTGFLGMEGLEDLDLLTVPLPLRDGDTLLMCSDGVGGVMEEQELLYCLNQGKAEEVCEAIRQRISSKAKPCQDNFTAVVIQCVM